MGDYDGDTDTDFAVFRRPTGVWYVEGGVTTAFGAEGDTAVPADYDGDGRDEIAVYRHANGVWYVQGGATTTFGGDPEDVPVPGDYDGDGDTDIAVWRPATDLRYILDGDPPAVAWGSGLAGDIPLPLPNPLPWFRLPPAP